jgi:plasmid stability protein
MATLTVKNVPEVLVQRLKQQAALHRRSLNLEVIASLERATMARAVDVESIIARARASRKRLEGVDVGAVLKHVKAQRRF